MRMRRGRLALGAGAAVVALVVGTVLAPALASAATGEESAGQAVGNRVERLKGALQGLVDKGTIDETQRDRVAEHLAEELGPRGPHGKGLGRGHGPGRPGFGPGGRGIGALKVGLEVAAEALGMPEDELAAELRDGKSLADVAGERDVPVEKVTGALKAAAEARIDEAVAEGRLSAEEAAEKKAALDEHLARVVQRSGPGRGLGWGPGGNPNEPDEPEVEEQEREGQTEPSVYSG